MTEAILTYESKSVPFEAIYEYVSKVSVPIIVIVIIIIIFPVQKGMMRFITLLSYYSSNYHLLFVNQRWKSVRRRDGSTYTTDCKRAIQANLRHNPSHLALFRVSKLIHQLII